MATPSGSEITLTRLFTTVMAAAKKRNPESAGMPGRATEASASPRPSRVPWKREKMPLWASERRSGSSTLLLVVSGGLVTGFEAGLAVPDWPNTFGHFMFMYPPGKMSGGVHYEHVHRLTGTLVGLTTVTLAVQWCDSCCWVMMRDGSWSLARRADAGVFGEYVEEAQRRQRPRGACMMPQEV